MKKVLIVLSLILLAGVFAAAVLAQPQEKCPASPAWPMGQMYNPKTVETLDGKIESIEKVTAGGTDVPVSPGDYIQVRGSRVTLENMTMILPNEITKGSEVMQFWDEQDGPRWRGQGPGAPNK